MRLRARESNPVVLSESGYEPDEFTGTPRPQKCPSLRAVPLLGPHCFADRRGAAREPAHSKAGF